jgi:hypothetical protein
VARLLLLGTLLLSAPSPQEEDKFWSQVEEIRKAAKDNCLERDAVECCFRIWKPEDVQTFWTHLLKLLDESYRWDIWAVGALLDGHVGLEFFLDFQVLIILQGREFYEGALKDPKSVTERFREDTPSTRFDLSALRSAAFSVPGLKDPQKARAGREPAGKKWTWRELKTMHPDLWDRYFLKRDRKPELPDLKSLKSQELVEAAVYPLWDWIDICSEPEYYLEQVGTLSKAQRCLMGVVWMQSEVSNGGYDEFFLNSTGVVAPEALEGTKLFGAKKLEVGLAEVMGEFSGGAPSRDHAKRKLQKKARWNDTLIDDEFEVPWGGMAKLPARIAAYIRANPTEFFRPRKP